MRSTVAIWSFLKRIFASHVNSGDNVCGWAADISNTQHRTDNLQCLIGHLEVAETFSMANVSQNRLPVCIDCPLQLSYA